MKYEEKFINDENKLFEVFINDSFKIPAYHSDANPRGGIRSPFYLSTQYHNLELIIDNRCSQNCEYCYLTKHKDELSVNHHVPKEQILNNLSSIMNFFTNEKHYLFDEYELYAGDLFATGMFFDCLDVLYPYFETIYYKLPDWSLNQKTIKLTIPCSYGQFINDKDIVSKIYQYFDKFIRINVLINLSWSHDGKFSTTRENGIQFSEENYQTAFKLVDDTGSGIHPMISPSNVKLAIQNYKWWEDCFQKYLKNRTEDRLYGPGCLELRDNGWDKESIAAYEKYIEWRINDLVNKFESPEDFCNYLYRGETHLKENFFRTYEEILSPLLDLRQKNIDKMSCTFQDTLMIRCSDLAVVPCHRTAYPQFIGGWFTTDDNNKIIGYKAHNVSQMISMKMRKTSFDPTCCVCAFRPYCIQGCLGSQYESTGELYLPVFSVCEMQKHKIITELKTYQKLGILDIMIQMGGVVAEKGNLLKNFYEEYSDLNKTSKGGYNGQCNSCG